MKTAKLNAHNGTYQVSETKNNLICIRKITDNDLYYASFWTDKEFKTCLPELYNKWKYCDTKLWKTLEEMGKQTYYEGHTTY